jgi:hypothetical protein
LANKGGDLFVGGEAKGDELLDGELGDVGELVGGNERGDAEALFETDEAVLQLEVVDAALDGEDEEGERDDDGPMAQVWILVAEMDGDVDGDSEVDEESGKDEEVHGGVEAAVVFIGLGCGHVILSNFQRDARA